MRSPQTTRNLTSYPVEVGATEAVLAGLPDTDSLIELPDIPSGERKEARDFILDIMQDITVALWQGAGECICPEERFYWEHSALESAHSRSLEFKDLSELLTISAQLPVSAWQGDMLAVRKAAAPHAGSAPEYLEAITRAILLAIRHLIWETTAALIGDGILTWNGRWLVWQETEVRPVWRDTPSAAADR